MVGDTSDRLPEAINRSNQLPELRVSMGEGSRHTRAENRCQVPRLAHKHLQPNHEPHLVRAASAYASHQRLDTEPEPSNGEKTHETANPVVPGASFQIAATSRGKPDNKQKL